MMQVMIWWNNNYKAELLYAVLMLSSLAYEVDARDIDNDDDYEYDYDDGND